MLHPTKGRTSALSKMYDPTYYSPVQEHSSQRRHIQQSAIVDTMILSLECNVLAGLCEAAVLTSISLSTQQCCLEIYCLETNCLEINGLPMH